MAFVYRYLDPTSRAVLYIGKTSGDNLASLAARISAHAKEDKFKSHEPQKGYIIEYVPGLSASDADIIETALINKASDPPPMNKGKTNWGASSCVVIPELQWRLWETYSTCSRTPASSDNGVLIPVTRYAEQEKITLQAAYKRIRSGKVPAVMARGPYNKPSLFVMARPDDETPSHTSAELSGAAAFLASQIEAKDKQIEFLMGVINCLQKQIMALHEREEAAP